MQDCSVCNKLQIVPGDIEDYKQLAHYHYRDERPAPFTAIFALRPTGRLRGALGTKAVGVIVYTTPRPALELRNIATGGLFTGFDRYTQLGLVNKNIRFISRVIIEPRFRSLGLASRLVRETMPRLNVPIVEALAVMGRVSPFLERAGMKAYQAEIPRRCVQLIEAFSTVGIEQTQLIDAQEVQHRLQQLPTRQAKFMEDETKRFLQAYSGRRDMAPGPERTRYILSKLTDRPVYYIWFNPRLAVAGTATSNPDQKLDNDKQD